MKENRIKEDDSPEEIQKKQLYAKLCAHKKPYFFAYNYSQLKTEYDTFIKNARSNAMSLYKKELEQFIEEYNNGQLTDENEIQFMKNFYYKLPLDQSASTMNRICWAIEKEFNGVDLFKDVVFDYSPLKSTQEYSQDVFNVVRHICNTYKPAVMLAKKRAATQPDQEGEDDWQSVDIIEQNLIESLYMNCPNEEELCNILVDLCYGGNIPKQIVWRACGNVILNRLLQRHNGKMSYPHRDNNGDFWCQGIRYSMKEIVVGGEDFEAV